MTAPAPGRPRWQVVGALGIVQIFAWGSTYYLLAVLAGPIAADTGWPVGWIMGALSLGLLTAGAVSPAVGLAIARRGGRPVLAAGALLIAAGLGLVALAPWLWLFVAGWMVTGAGMAASLYDPAFATLGRLYGSGSRRAISVLTLWGGFASTVCWPLSAVMLTHLGWRGTAAAYALWQIGVSLPLILTLIPREAPRPAPRVGGRGGARLSGADRAGFLLMALLLVTTGLLVTTVSVHLLTFLVDQGASLAAAVALGTLIGPAQVGARLAEMAGGSRHHPVWTMAAAVGLTGSGLVLLAFGLGLPALALLLYGAGNGIFSIARGALPMSLFGPDRYAQLMGRLARPSLLAQAAAPLLAGLMIDRLGPAATLHLVAGLGAANLLWCAGLAVLVRGRAGLPV